MWNEVDCLDLATGKRFIKKFDDIRAQRRFLIRCKHSQKIIVLGYTYDGQDEYEYLVSGY